MYYKKQQKALYIYFGHISVTVKFIKQLFIRKFLFWYHTPGGLGLYYTMYPEQDNYLDITYCPLCTVRNSPILWSIYIYSIHTRTYTYPLSLSLSHTHTHSLSHTRTLLHTSSHTLTHTQTETHIHTRSWKRFYGSIKNVHSSLNNCPKWTSRRHNDN